MTAIKTDFLIESMEADRLIVLFGAGLSMAPPSSLPSATQVANDSYDRYAPFAEEKPDELLRDDLEKLAEMFAERQRLQSVFLRRVVAWDNFVAEPNVGHRAIADFILTRGIVAAVTTNFDDLVEQSARAWKKRLEIALDGDEAGATLQTQSPYLKLHGCFARDPERTIWTKSQLRDDALIAERIERSRIWMASHLRNKDMLIIGFWSDWTYLNELLASVVKTVAPLSVTIVDPMSQSSLKLKAPTLWRILRRKGVRFEHVRMSGAEFLDRLRVAFSRRFLRFAFDAGRKVYKEQVGDAVQDEWFEPPSGGNDVLYDVRRDAEGVPRSGAATKKLPEKTDAFAFCHLLLRKAGAIQDGSEYVVAEGSIRVRVVNGAGNDVASMKARYSLEPPVGAAQVVVCAGGVHFGPPDNVVRAGTPHHILRPAAAAEWLDLGEARKQLGF